MKIYSIKNEKLNFFNRPIYVESSNEALTYVQNILMSDADRVLYGLKSELALYELGEIDFVTGTIIPLDKPEFCCTLEEIFSSIPEDHVPKTEKYLIEKIRELENLIKVKNEIEFPKKSKSKKSKKIKLVEEEC